MTDFLTRLANRTRGLTPKVHPVIPSRFASQSDRGRMSEHWADDLDILLHSSDDALSLAPQSTPVSPSDIAMAAQTKSNLVPNLPRTADTTIVNPVVDPTLEVSSALEASSYTISEAFAQAEPPPSPTSIPAASDRANQGSELVQSMGLGDSDRRQDLRLRPPSLPNLGGTGFTPPKLGESGEQNDSVGVSPGRESQAHSEFASPSIRSQINESEVLSEPVTPLIEPPVSRVSDRSDTLDFPASTDSPSRTSSNHDLFLRSPSEDSLQPSSLANSSSTTQPSINFQQGRQENDRVSSVPSPTGKTTLPHIPANSSSTTQASTSFLEGRQENYPISSVRSLAEDVVQPASLAHSASSAQSLSNSPVVRRKSESVSSQYGSNRANLTSPTPLPNQKMGEPNFPFVTGEGTGERLSEQYQVLSQQLPTESSAPLVLPANSTSTTQQSANMPAARRDSNQESSGQLPPEMAVQPAFPVSSTRAEIRRESNQEFSMRSHADEPETSEPTANVQPLSRQQSRLLQVNAHRADWTDSLNPDSLLSPSSTESPPTIQVTIGRVEVRVSSPPPPPRPQSPRRSSPLSLNDYLQQRNGK
jgi:hypothetical protein